jgi:molybdopterin molybdotransferase
MVRRQPVVGLLATGSELLEAGQTAQSGKIFESNRITLAPLLARAGAVPRRFPLVRDTLEETRNALTSAFAECDAVVTTGGVSVGELDFVKSAFEQLGGALEFWKVSIRPGKPFVFGRLGEKFLFGLPGNPVSAAVTFLVLVRPVLLRWQGAERVEMPSHPGTLSEPLANVGDRRHFMRVIADEQGAVRPASGQASHQLGSLAQANGLVDVPPKTILAAGTNVRVLRIEE